MVLLAAGGSDRGRELVSAHSGALASGDGAWEALADAYGMHRAGDLAELADTLELFAIGRRAHGGGVGSGIATIHDSGLERAHVADLAGRLGVPFADIGPGTRDRLAAVLDPGLEPANPLDIWGTGRDAERQFAESLTVMSDDPAVAAVALAVDLVPEFDGDQSYPQALLTAAGRTGKPLAVLAGLPASIDPVVAARLREAGVPVLEGARTGLLALRHFLDHQDRARARAAGAGQLPEPGSATAAGVLPELGPAAGAGQPEPGSAAAAGAGGVQRPADDPGRRGRWADALARGRLGGAGLPAMLRDYGIPAVQVRAADTREAVLAAAGQIGYPVVLKTDEPGVAHKSDVGGVLLGLDGPDALAAGYSGSVRPARSPGARVPDRGAGYRDAARHRP